ncbi:ArsR family transcriptional regulator [Actinopolymorpha sp. B17G11]|uniref:arsenate reductase/protein-tyrosine-phosphatase family protein n=1 Tax=unclassified Actinopolymorpha TaxID=2627063 RepID=UPI0032D979E4
MVSDPDVAPPPFVQLAGHELRWRLLRELAQSDRRVRELVTEIDEPQNLVSYHLGKLRSAGLVTTRRSSADGRDIYYHLDLARCAELLAGTGAALHPGLAHAPSPAPPRRASSRRVRVLFLCTGNTARSPMAAALLRHRTHGKVETTSAGSHPKPLSPHAVRALREYDVDLSDHRPRHVDAFTSERFDYVISLCDRAREVCPDFAYHPRFVHWSIPDPNAATASDPGGTGYPAFRRTAAELDTRIRFLIPVLQQQPRGQPTRRL